MRVFLYTVGCKLNQSETHQIAKWLQGRGFTLSPDLESADLVVLNTCAVTSEASRKSHKKLTHFLKTGKKVIVTGCAYEHDKSRFRDTPLHISMKWRDSITKELLPSSKKSRMFIKIEDGCIRKCTYCLPSRIRRYYSLSPDIIFKNIRKALEENFHEVVLTGLNISLYKYNEYDLKKLMKELDKNFSKEKLIIRLSSIEPEFIDKEFIEVFSSDIFARHLHIPFQHFSEKVLKKMGRISKKQENNYEYIFNLIEKNLKNAGIGSDIIVGFPEEENDDFIKTLSVIKNSPLTYLHIFPYSKRKGTPAYNIKKELKHSIKKERVAKLKEIDRTLRSNHKKKQEDKVLRGIVVGKEKILTENYITFPFNGNAKNRQLINVLINKGKAFLYEEHKIAINF